MNNGVTKTTVIIAIVGIVIIVLALGIDMWFGIELGIFKWGIIGLAAGLSGGIVGSQISKARKQERRNL